MEGPVQLPIRAEKGGRYFKDAPDRIMVVERVYHNSDEDGVNEVTYRFMRHLKGREQPYVRRLSITSEWTPLDSGWVEKASMVSILNGSGDILKSNPNEARISEHDGSVLEMSYDKDPDKAFLIFPQESFRGLPSNVKGLHLRSRGKTIKVSIRVYPE